jgi:signal transduction histidine kinase
MPAHPSHDSGREASAAARGITAGAIALVVTGASLAWAAFDAPGSALKLVAGGGAAAAVVIVVAVAMAVYYAQAARGSRIDGSSKSLEADRMAAEFAQLARETLPSLVRQAGGGSDPGTVLAGIRKPESPAVRAVLTTVVSEVAAVGRREAEATAARAALEAEVASVAETTLRAAIRQMRDGQSADTVLNGVAYPDSRPLRGLLDTVVSEVAVAERRGAAAMAACASAAARIQAQATRMLAELREMENRHGGEEKVFADLMELDHQVSQLGRLADSIALLAGGRSGRRWTKPIPMESILRGAMSRIDAYQRIRLHSTSRSAVAGYAAEGVMHALAELMDNATAFSAHGSEVHVYAEEEDAGVVVTIEDGGLGMRKRERGRAEGLIAQPFNLATLPGTRLGLAVVGRVADRYGLSVNFRPSSRGGTGVVVMIPRQLIVQRREHVPGDAQAADATEPDRVPRFARIEERAADDGKSEVAMESTGDGDDLPVRPRGRTLASASMPGQETPASAAPEQARDASSRFAAFREAGERTRNALSGEQDEAT